MNLSDLLSPDRIIAEIQADDQWGAVGEIVARLDAIGALGVAEPGRIMELLQAREEQMSTGIGSGVGIPHAFTADITKVVAGFGRVPDGVDFDAADNAPVEFIIVLLVPEDQHSAHLKTLASVGRLFSDGNVRNSIREAEGAEGILAVVEESCPRLPS